MITFFKKILKDTDKPLLIITIVMFVFGLLNIVTASSRAVVVLYNTSLYNYFFHQGVTLLLGSIITAFILIVPTKKYYSLMYFAYFGVLASLAYLSIYGSFHKGSKNWIDFPIFGSFQPSELAKPVVIICLAILFEKFYTKLRNKTINHYDLIAKILFVGCTFPIIIFLHKDLGTMMILMAIFAIMFLTSPILRIEKLKTIGLGIVLMIAAAGIYVINTGGLLSDTQSSRFDFFDPCSNYDDGGYQICNGFIAINQGGLLGVGIGNSTQVTYIPESHTDSVFAIISEEYGFLRSSFIFLGYAIILFRILIISSSASTIRGKYICLGVATYIFLHIFINLGGLFGVIPLTGVPLPFLSYGGSFTLSLIIALAVVQRVHIEKVREKIKI